MGLWDGMSYFTSSEIAGTYPLDMVRLRDLQDWQSSRGIRALLPQLLPGQIDLFIGTIRDLTFQFVSQGIEAQSSSPITGISRPGLGKMKFSVFHIAFHS
jgi:hypothetical protein